jgi:sugar-specific transcriptional regulator TrmB
MNSPTYRALILKRFKEIGLSSNEVKSYLCLLERDTLTVPEISKLAGIPPPNAYRALERLMSKGLCISRPGPRKKYSASDPSLLEDKLIADLNAATKMDLDNLRKREKEILEKAKVARENIGAMIRELKPQYECRQQRTNPLDYIEIIKDPYQIHKRFMQLVAAAGEEIIAFCKPPYSGPKERLQEQFEQQAEQLRRGVRLKAIYEVPQDREEGLWLLEALNSAAKYGEESRVIKRLPMKMVIFDEKIALFALQDPISREISLTSQIVEHPALAESLKILFETLWGQAEDYHILGL